MSSLVKELDSGRLTIVQPTSKPDIVLQAARKELEFVKASLNGNPISVTLTRVISRQQRTKITNIDSASSAITEGRRFYYQGELYDIAIEDLNAVRSAGFSHLIPRIKREDSRKYRVFVREVAGSGVFISHLERCAIGARRFWAKHIVGKEAAIAFLQAFGSSEPSEVIKVIESLEKDHFPALVPQATLQPNLEKDHFPASSSAVTSRDNELLLEIRDMLYRLLPLIERLDGVDLKVSELLERPICSGGKQFYRDNFVPPGGFIDHLFNELDKLIASGSSAESAYRALYRQAETEGTLTHQLYQEYVKNRDKKDITPAMIKYWYKKLFYRDDDGKVRRRDGRE